MEWRRSNSSRTGGDTASPDYNERAARAKWSASDTRAQNWGAEGPDEQNGHATIKWRLHLPHILGLPVAGAALADRGQPKTQRHQRGRGRPSLRDLQTDRGCARRYVHAGPTLAGATERDVRGRENRASCARAPPWWVSYQNANRGTHSTSGSPRSGERRGYSRSQAFILTTRTREDRGNQGLDDCQLSPDNIKQCLMEQYDLQGTNISSTSWASTPGRDRIERHPPCCKCDVGGNASGHRPSYLHVTAFTRTF